MSAAKVELLLHVADQLRIASMDACEALGIPAETRLMAFGRPPQAAHEFLSEYVFRTAVKSADAIFVMRFLLQYMPEPPELPPNARGAFRKPVVDSRIAKSDRRALSKQAKQKGCESESLPSSTTEPPTPEQHAAAQATLRAMLAEASGGASNEGLTPEELAKGEESLRALIASQVVDDEPVVAIGAGAVIE